MRLFHAGVLLIAMGAALSGCSSDRNSAADPADKSLDVVRWGFFRNYQPVYVGLAENFFKEAGIDLQLTGSFASGPAVVQAAGAGEIDAGHSAITGIVNAASGGVDVVGVADSQTEFVEAPLQRWYVRADSNIRSVADLKGKTIGTNSLSGSFPYTAKLALSANGLSESDVKFVVVPHDRQEQALRSGQIDVAGLIDPYTVQIERSGVRRLFTGAEILGERQISLVFFTKSYASAHPDVVKRFQEAYRRSIEFIDAHEAEAATAMASRLGLQADLLPVHRYVPQAAVRVEDIRFWIDTMYRFGDLKNPDSIQPEQLVWK